MMVSQVFPMSSPTRTALLSSAFSPNRRPSSGNDLPLLVLQKKPPDGDEDYLDNLVSSVFCTGVMARGKFNNVLPPPFIVLFLCFLLLKFAKVDRMLLNL